MRITLVASVLVGLMALLAPGTARSDSFEKHIKKYHKHMKEAYEEYREGDWDDYYEELGKAQREYDKAYRYGPPMRHYPRFEPPAYYDYAPYHAPRRHWGFNFGFGFGRPHCW